jgi:hypothetical protein
MIEFTSREQRVLDDVRAAAQRGSAEIVLDYYWHPEQLKRVRRVLSDEGIRIRAKTVAAGVLVSLRIFDATP